MSDLNVLFFEVGKDPVRITIQNKLEKMQALVGGYIEPVRITHDLTLVCNEDGMSLNLRPNRVAPSIHDVILGNFFITSDGPDGDFVSLTSEQISEALSYMDGKRI